MTSRPDANPPRQTRPANPRRPNRPLLIASSAALVLWTIVLVLIALRVV
jgi:hypothetical protein